MTRRAGRVESVGRYTIIDNETGEVITDNGMFIGKNPFVEKGWRKVFVGFLADIVLDGEIVGKSARLLLWMIGELRFNSLEVYMSERIVCEELGIKPATYYRWVKTLIERGLIEKVDTNLYRLVPYTAVNGHTEKAVALDAKKRTKSKNKNKSKKRKNKNR